MKIIVLAGGTSTERKVSIVSGTNVCKALREKGHLAVLVDVFCGVENADPAKFFPEHYDVDEASAYMSSFNDRVPALQASRKSFFGPNVLAMCEQADVVFLALHGANGEDGRLQATFDLMGIPYTGTGYLSSALAMDKTITKYIFQAKGVPTAKGYEISRHHALATPDDKGLSYPVIVKPACGGSSVGCTIAENIEQFKASVATAFQLEDKAVVEEFFKGREFSVGVVEGKALPVIEIAPKEGWYDYKNKYVPGATIETCPAQITQEQTLRMQRHAEDAMMALGITSYGRIDFLMNEQGQMIVLEANTLPGMTATSLLPQEAAETGVPYADLCEKLIQVSLKNF